MEKRAIYQMRLFKVHFEKIERGEKTVEMRLMDEKRQRIREGDLITFTCEEEPHRAVTVEVVGVRAFSDFSDLAACFGTRAVGFDGRDAAFVGAYMKEIYGDDALRTYGAAAIEVHLLPKE